jgi:type II secretory pathway pseudopilin PulG
MKSSGQRSAISNQQSAASRRRGALGVRRTWAFTLVEALIVVLLLGIVFGLGLPKLGDNRMLSLREAARMMAADIEFAQSESIVHGDDARLVKFDTSNSSYWVAAASAPDTPVTDPSNRRPFLTVFGSGRASSMAGVVIQSVSAGGDAILKFDAYGCPDQATDATVQLAIQAAGGTQTLTVRVKAGSGEVSIQ